MNLIQLDYTKNSITVLESLLKIFIGSPELVRQTRRVLSRDPDATVLPSGEKQQQRIC